jgi:hypothetical protein
MSHTEEASRRRYERIPCDGSFAVLHGPGGAQHRVRMIDISRGGVAVQTAWTGDVGAAVHVTLPDAGAPVAARTIRAEDGLLALAFAQNEAVFEKVDALMDRMLQKAA